MINENNSKIGLHGSAFAGTPWVVMEPQKISALVNENYSPLANENIVKSNFSSSQCYNRCGLLHAFNSVAKAACQKACDDDAKKEQDALDALQNSLNSTSGLSTGAIVGISLGVVALGLGTIFLVRGYKKRNAA